MFLLRVWKKSYRTFQYIKENKIVLDCWKLWRFDVRQWPCGFKYFIDLNLLIYLKTEWKCSQHTWYNTQHQHSYHSKNWVNAQKESGCRWDSCWGPESGPWARSKARQNGMWDFFFFFPLLCLCWHKKKHLGLLKVTVSRRMSRKVVVNLG